MADINKSIRYSVEFDTATGKRQIKQILQDAQAEASSSSGSSSGTTGTTPENTVSIASDSIKESAKSIGEMLKGNLGAILGSALPQLLHGNIGGALETAGGAVGGALTQAGLGVWGAVASGAVAVAAGFATLVKSIFSFGESLSGLNGQLFQAYGRFDLVMEGLKIDMAQKLGPSISLIVGKLSELAVELEPLAVDVLKPIIEKLGELLRYLTPIIGLVVSGLIPAIENIISICKIVNDVIKVVIDGIIYSVSLVIRALGGLVSFIGNMPGVGKLTGVDFKATGEQMAIFGKSLGESAGDSFLDHAKDIGKNIKNVFDNVTFQSANGKKFLDALDKAATAFSGGATGSNGINEAIARANALNLSLFNQFKNWAHTAKTGMQGGIRHLTLDMAHDFRKDVARFQHGVGDKRPSDTFIDKAKPGQGVPRPSAAAVHFKVSDYVEIQAQDESQVHFELMMHMQKIQEWYGRAKDISWLTRQRAFNKIHARMA